MPRHVIHHQSDTMMRYAQRVKHISSGIDETALKQLLAYSNPTWQQPLQILYPRNQSLPDCVFNEAPSFFLCLHLLTSYPHHKYQDWPQPKLILAKSRSVDPCCNPLPSLARSCCQERKRIGCECPTTRPAVSQGGMKQSARGGCLQCCLARPWRAAKSPGRAGR